MVSKLGRLLVQATVLFVVFGINTATALPYDGMCQDNNPGIDVQNCNVYIGTDAASGDYTECVTFGSPSCPAGTQQSVIEPEKSCGFLGLGTQYLCMDFCTVTVACEGCVAGYYGSDCSGVCNCGPNGSCNDNIDGDGTCSCDEGWGGAQCNNCAPGHFGLDCTPCACGEGASCSTNIRFRECGCDDPS